MTISNPFRIILLAGMLAISQRVIVGDDQLKLRSNLIMTIGRIIGAVILIALFVAIVVVLVKQVF